MPQKNKEHPLLKSKLHPRNKHRERYDFKVLINTFPDLAKFVIKNKFEDESIDFFSPEAVKALNKALLKHYYSIDFWEIPNNYLCPPIPGRADYIHHIADLLGSCDNGNIPIGKKIKCIDIGVGANCVYPIIGKYEYGWSFVGTDIDQLSIKSANKIVASNAALEGNIELRLQSNPKGIFNGIINKNEFFDLSICNPPFHSSAADAQAGTVRKIGNLKHKKIHTPILNFGGNKNELWCEGGEKRFIQNMIMESKQYSNACFWFSTLLAKKDNLHSVYTNLKKAGVSDVKTISVGQGNKISRIIAWTFLSKEQQNNWINLRWKELPIID